MKGVILVGGTGTRLFPLTKSINKHLLPAYNKPLVFYPLSTLILAGCKNILVVCDIDQVSQFEENIGDGRNLGISIQYKGQSSPDGIAHALLCAEEFIENDVFCLLLGDNIFLEEELPSLLSNAYETVAKGVVKGQVFLKEVNDASEYGVAVFDSEGCLIDIEEKPPIPKSKSVVTGLYVYDSTVLKMAKKQKPSSRGELEITDLNKELLYAGALGDCRLNLDGMWFDAGSHKKMLEASKMVHDLEDDTGRLHGCPIESSWRKGFIDENMLESLLSNYPTKNNVYCQSLHALLNV